MGVVGTNIQSAITNVVENENFRTAITIIPIERSDITYGGYGGENSVESTEVVTYGIPYRYVKTRLGFEKFGDLKEGETRIIIKGTEEIDTNYKISMNSQDFDVIEVDPLLFNDVVVAYVLTLSKRQ